MAEALFWDGKTDVPRDRLDWLDRDLADYVATTAGMTRFALRLATFVIQWSPLLMLGRPRRLVSLPREQRLVCLQKMERSRVALFALLLGVAKVMMALVYFENPEALAATGFDGDCYEGVHPAAEVAAGA